MLEVVHIYIWLAIGFTAGVIAVTLIQANGPDA